MLPNTAESESCVIIILFFLQYFTISLSDGCVSFLVHAFLPAMLLPICQRGGGAYVFGRGGTGHALECRVCPGKINEWHHTSQSDDVQQEKGGLVAHRHSDRGWKA